MNTIAKQTGWGRTALIAKIGEIKANPSLIKDRQIRAKIKMKRRRFMGT